MPKSGGLITCVLDRLLAWSPHARHVEKTGPLEKSGRLCEVTASVGGDMTMTMAFGERNETSRRPLSLYAKFALLPWY